MDAYKKKTTTTRATPPNTTKLAHKDKSKCPPKQPPFHCGTGQPGTIVDPVRPKPPVIVDPVRVSSGGFIWVNGHWERARATQGVSGPAMIVDPTLAGPVVLDHRTPTLPPLSNGNGQGGVNVANTDTGQVINQSQSFPIISGNNVANTGNGQGGYHYQGYQGPNVRDHRNGAPQGGVSVTKTPGSTRNNDVIGVGASPVDSAISGIGNAVESGVGSLVNGIGVRH